MNKFSRYKYIAEKAILDYSINVTKIEFFSEETNILFLVTANNEKYILKIFREEGSMLDDNLTEIFFLERIGNKSNVAVPKILHNNNNEAITFVYDDIECTTKRIIMYKYIEGNDL